MYLKTALSKNNKQYKNSTSVWRTKRRFTVDDLFYAVKNLSDQDGILYHNPY
jgi:hypothetical protein